MSGFLIKYLDIKCADLFKDVQVYKTAIHAHRSMELPVKANDALQHLLESLCIQIRVPQNGQY